MSEDHENRNAQEHMPSAEAARKLLYLANRDITKKWTAPIRDWAKILNQLAILFEGRFPM